MGLVDAVSAKCQYGLDFNICQVYFIYFHFKFLGHSFTSKYQAIFTG